MVRIELIIIKKNLKAIFKIWFLKIIQVLLMATEK